MVWSPNSNVCIQLKSKNVMHTQNSDTKGALIWSQRNKLCAQPILFFELALIQQWEDIYCCPFYLYPPIRCKLCPTEWLFRMSRKYKGLKWEKMWYQVKKYKSNSNIKHTWGIHRSSDIIQAKPIITYCLLEVQTWLVKGKQIA